MGSVREVTLPPTVSNSTAFLDLRFELRGLIVVFGVHDAHDELASLFTHRLEVPVDLIFGRRTVMLLMLHLNMMVFQYLEGNSVCQCVRMIGKGLRRGGRG